MKKHRPGLGMEKNTKIALYRNISFLRQVEEKIAKLYPEQEMRCPVHLCIGQEAAEIGSAMALRQEDYVVSGHRSHGHYLGKGGDLKKMMAEIYGKATGCVGGKGGSMHLLDLEAGFLGSVPIVGSIIPIGVGTAFSSAQKKEKRVTMVYFGDGACEAGVVHESLNFAALKKLPVVFVCENNAYSVYSPLNVRQPEGREILDLAKAHGIETMKVDGNDVEATYEASLKAAEHARQGDGPVFMELTTYRWREHCGPNFDNDIGYRSEEEYLEWKAKDPVLKYQDQLVEEGILSEGDITSINASIENEIDEAFAFAKNSPFPRVEDANFNVYAE
jgi:pyruvate dehydrogenase E1 component alpha subunit